MAMTSKASSSNKMSAKRSFAVEMTDSASSGLSTSATMSASASMCEKSSNKIFLTEGMSDATSLNSNKIGHGPKRSPMNMIFSMSTMMSQMSSISESTDVAGLLYPQLPELPALLRITTPEDEPVLSGTDAGGLQPDGVWARARNCREYKSVIAELESGDDERIQVIIDGMRGHVCESLRHSHANLVMKLIISTVHWDKVGFIIDEIVGNVEVAMKAARHKTGCRVLETLFQTWPAAKLQPVFDLLLSDFDEIVRNEHGNWIWQRALGSCTPAQQRAIAKRLCADIFDLAVHPFGCRVVQKAMYKGGASSRDPVLGALLSQPDFLLAAASHQYGHLTVIGILNLRQAAKDVRLAKSILTPFATELQKSKFGKAVARLL